MTFEEWWAEYRRNSAMALSGFADLDDPHVEIIAARAWEAGVDSQLGLAALQIANSALRKRVQELEGNRE